MSTEEIEKEAIRELEREAKQGAVRASVSGALGWQRPKLCKLNKVFLNNMILSSARDRKRNPQVKSNSRNPLQNNASRVKERKKERTHKKPGGTQKQPIEEGNVESPPRKTFKESRDERNVTMEQR